ncbi:MAG: hypothetical protein GY794_16100 [bacterium]|nr:hypothetical protein [bacterium]
MHRHGDKIELTHAEIQCLYGYLFGGPVPDDQPIDDAALACAFYVGVEYLEETLNKCRKENL